MATLGPRPPHGPAFEDTHQAPMAPPITDNERQIFNYLIRPDDSYDENGVYWADMKIPRRIKFVTAVDNAETAREFKAFLSMVKADPLSPIGYYFRNMVIPGAGLGLEGYVLFSIGNLTSLFAAPGAWPTCWGSASKTNVLVCNPIWIDAVNYLELIGILIGQATVGVLGDWLGRRWGLIQDAIIMFIGLLMLTASWGTSLNGWVICYAWSLFFYSFGVGGEYPMTATSATENGTGSGKVSTREDRLHRGRKVTSAFLMQGWGQFFNQAILIILLLIFHGGSSPPYGKAAVQWTYRLSFALPAIGTLWLVYYRSYKVPLASKQLNDAKLKRKVTGYDIQSLKLTFNHFGSRVLATSIGWFCNDVFFYGNKLFQGQFIKVLDPGTKSVMPNWLLNLGNVGIELAGYYLASFLIDNKLYGRKMMQQVGFLACFICFVIPGFDYSYYSSEAGSSRFMAMYYLSSFFNQFGPNAVTFLVAAEVYPTPIRATAHGFSAASGKLGALTAAIMYAYIPVSTRFLVVPWFGLAGMLVTFFFLPDTTGLDLKEAERRWLYITEGREHEYHGVAVHHKHLSVWERFRGAGKYYDPDLDYKQKIEDMRSEWEESVAQKYNEKGGMLDKADFESEEGGEVFSSDVSTYFAKSSKSPFLSAQIKRSGTVNEKSEMLPEARGYGANTSSDSDEHSQEKN